MMLIKKKWGGVYKNIWLLSFNDYLKGIICESDVKVNSW